MSFSLVCDMDSGPQLVMVGKKFAHELRLAVDGRQLGSLLIYTFIGHVEQAIGYIWEPLQLGFRDPPAPLLLRCAVMDATNHDILIGQKTI